MKFLSLLGLAALIHCASAAQDLDTGTDPVLGGLDDGGNDVKEVTLVSCDETTEVTLNHKWTEIAETIKNILEGDKSLLVVKEDGSHKIILKNKDVTGPILTLIAEYIKHHKGKKPADIVKPIRSVLMQKVVEDAWDAKFIDGIACADQEYEKWVEENADKEDAEDAAWTPIPFTNKKQLFQIILAANYVGLKGLIHLGCAKTATQIKGKTPEEIKKILGDGDGRRRLSQIFGLDKLLESDRGL